MFQTVLSLGALHWNKTKGKGSLDCWRGGESSLRYWDWKGKEMWGRGWGCLSKAELAGEEGMVVGSEPLVSSCDINLVDCDKL